MLVAEWMTRAPLTVSQDATVSEASRLMVKHKIRRIPVVTADGSDRLMGMVTKSDVLGAAPATLNPFSPGATDAPSLAMPVRAVMSLAPVTTVGTAPLELAAQIMLDHKVGGLPVLVNGRLVGIVTRSDIFRAFTVALGGHGPGLRVTFDVRPDEDIITFIGGLAKRHHLRVSSIATFTKDVGMGGAAPGATPQEIAVVRLEGAASTPLVDELWKTGHRVQSVLHIEADGRPKSS
jgi:acetoin utilization protein AcuB